MPNWCQNRLEINGPEEAIAKIAQACRVPDGEFDFNGIVPMPPELDITSGSSTHWAYDVLYGDWQDVRLHRAETLLSLFGTLPETREEMIDMIERAPACYEHKSANPFWLDLKEGRQARANEERFGVRDWYDWRIRHWGTKWNADSVGVDNLSGNNLTLWFATAWSPPIPVVEALCEQYPDVSAAMDYIETGAWFAGTVRGESGQIEDEPASDIRPFGEDVFGLEFDAEDDEAEEAAAL